MAQRLAHPTLGADYTDEIPTHLLIGAGIKTVYRYCGHFTPKCLTKGEKSRLESAGLGIVPVFEDGAKNAWEGYALGKANGEFALRWARDIGMPKGRPMPFAVDSEALNPSVLDPYFEGVAAVWGRSLCGPYGSKTVISHFADKGFWPGWQTYAWSNGQLDTRARNWQWSNDRFIAGHSVDLDYAFYADHGQWNFKAPVVTRHYERFVDHTFKIHAGGRWWHLNERYEVEHFDALIKHPQANHLAIQVQKVKLKVLRDRIKGVATRGKHKGWGIAWRWWRWQRLNARINQKV